MLILLKVRIIVKMAKLGTLYSQDMKGFSSFEADSLPSFDEFDSESVISYFKERFEEIR